MWAKASFSFSPEKILFSYFAATTTSEISSSITAVHENKHKVHLKIPVNSCAMARRERGDFPNPDGILHLKHGHCVFKK